MGKGFCDRMMMAARLRAAWPRSLRYRCLTIKAFNLCRDLRAPAFIVTLTLLLPGLWVFFAFLMVMVKPLFSGPEKIEDVLH
jgi:hypothetical protein